MLGFSVIIMSQEEYVGNRLTSTPTHLRDFVATVTVAQCNELLTLISAVVVHEHSSWLMEQLSQALEWHSAI